MLVVFLTTLIPEPGGEHDTNGASRWRGCERQKVPATAVGRPRERGTTRVAPDIYCRGRCLPFISKHLGERAYCGRWARKSGAYSDGDGCREEEQVRIGIEGP